MILNQLGNRFVGFVDLTELKQHARHPDLPIDSDVGIVLLELASKLADIGQSPFVLLLGQLSFRQKHSVL